MKGTGGLVTVIAMIILFAFWLSILLEGNPLFSKSISGLMRCVASRFLETVSIRE